MTNNSTIFVLYNTLYLN